MQPQDFVLGNLSGQKFYEIGWSSLILILMLLQPIFERHFLQKTKIPY